MYNVSIIGNEITIQNERAKAHLEVEKKSSTRAHFKVIIHDKVADKIMSFSKDVSLLENGKLKSYPLINFQVMGEELNDNATLKKFYENVLEMSYEEFKDSFLHSYSERVEMEVRRILK